jgi:hypothetical protein
MSLYLLANIGTRDVALGSLDDLPAEVVNPKSGLPIPRLAGEYLLQKDAFARHAARIQLPMIEKALKLIAPRNWGDLRIVLFATDQDTRVAEHYRANDTIHYGHLIRELLFARYEKDGMAKKQIEVRRSTSNPADYDQMYDFYHQELAVIARRDPPPNPAYLLIAGGTPQMNTMLLLLGTEAFGPGAVPLYASEERDRARKLDTVRLLYRQAFQRNLDVMLEAYAYGSALQLLQRNVDYLESEQAQLLESALRYALARRNLDLASAVQTLDDAIVSTRSLRETIASFQQEAEDGSDEALLRETIFLAQIAARSEGWADFLGRLHRFSEGCMQLLGERLGIVWSNAKKRSSYAPRWWDAQRSMLAQLGLASADPPADPQAENAAREVDRSNLRTIITALAGAPEHEAVRLALAELDRLDAPISLRHDIVHRFTPVSQDEIEKKAGASIEVILAAMRQTYQYAFGRPVPAESPYDSLNRLCADILKGQR